QAPELFGAVIAIAGGRIDPLRTQQADAVVVAQQAARHPRDTREFPDPEHRLRPSVRLVSSPDCPALRSVKVKPHFDRRSRACWRARQKKVTVRRRQTTTTRKPVWVVRTSLCIPLDQPIRQ